jgi:Predicted ATPase
MLSVESNYHKKIESGEWEPDLSQNELAIKLSHLSEYINQDYKKTIFNIFYKRKKISIRGFYIHGKVGIGKSVLMDMFYNSLEMESKLRIHFHLFMQEIHKKIKVQRKLSKRGDPIKYVAKNISKKYKVICLDEFQVNDTADAMILQRLFEKIFQKNTLLICTSNTEPNDLYFNGINRQLFFPFINLIKKECETFEIESKEDYRLKKLKSNEVYFTPIDKLNKKKFIEFFYYLANTKTFTPVALDIHARKIFINQAANGIGLPL